MKFTATYQVTNKKFNADDWDAYTQTERGYVLCSKTWDLPGQKPILESYYAQKSKKLPGIILSIA